MVSTADTFVLDVFVFTIDFTCTGKREAWKVEEVCDPIFALTMLKLIKHQIWQKRCCGTIEKITFD